MNRRRVLRRRIVVAVLLLLSVGMLTLYFRESGGGVVHSVQDTVLHVAAPLQKGTARAAKPFRDAWNWTADLFSARAENERLKAELEQLRAGVAADLATQAENEELRALVALDDGEIFPKNAKLLTTRVVARSTTAWYSTVTIGVGGDDGVRVYDAVVNGAGLVGRVTRVTPNAAQVTLITDQQSYVDASILPGGVRGMVAGSVTGDVTMDYVDKNEKVKVGQYVLTSGLRSSIFARGIPVGVVAAVGSQDVELYQSVSVRPFVDFHKLDVVQVVLR